MIISNNKKEIIEIDFHQEKCLLLIHLFSKRKIKVQEILKHLLYQGSATAHKTKMWLILLDGRVALLEIVIDIQPGFKGIKRGCL